MIVLMCGSRDWGSPSRPHAETERAFVKRVVDLLDPKDRVIHGGARGADSLSGAYAKLAGLKVTIYEANWRQFGRRAGPIRNQNMLDLGRPELVIYFTEDRDNPTTGTRDMVERARRANKPVIWYADYNGDRFGMGG